MIKMKDYIIGWTVFEGWFDLFCYYTYKVYTLNIYWLTCLNVIVT